MKKTLILVLLIFSVLNGYSQDYMTIIAEKSCECLDKMADTLDSQQYNMELGICILEASTPYKKQLKKDYNFNLDDINVDGEALGRIIGMKMAAICPDRLIEIARKAKSAQEPEVVHNKIQGVITKIENDFFVVFSLRDDSGKITKLYWLTFIETDLELTSTYASLTGKNVEIIYEIKDFFDPKIEEYRQFFIISKIEVEENLLSAPAEEDLSKIGI
jgi:hypothetical protein